MTLTGYWLLLAAIPVLMLGEWLSRRVGVLKRAHIPPPVIGGLIVAIVVLCVNHFQLARIVVNAKVNDRWWTWLTSTEIEWLKNPAPSVDVHTPLLIAFFTCIGLNASWAVAKKGSWQLLIYLLIATLFVFVQNGTGVALAKLMGESPLLGLQCGGVSLMGGFGTAAGFSKTMEEAGLANAALIGTAAAAFGVVAGSLMGGPFGRWLMENRVHRTKLAPSSAPLEPVVPAGVPGEHMLTSRDPALNNNLTTDPTFTDPPDAPETFFGEIRSLARQWPTLLLHLLVLGFCIKAGAWVSYWMVQQGATFPVYIGAMLVGVTLRNAHDFSGRTIISSEFVDRIASVCLGWMLATIMIGLRLGELLNSAGPMLVILVAQIIVMMAFAYFVVFRVMGKDYEAATMSVGMIGFGLGATSNAVATMKQMTRAYGPAPRAFLIVTVVGAFLIDFTNSIVIILFINFLKLPG